jgi:acyl phosphate:glycerol-3-phosphate acyltransferase
MVDIIAGIALPLALAYLAGSFPSAVVFGRVLRGLDPRELGSGNAGATNVLRSIGPLPAALTLLADIAKALAAVFLAPLAGGLALHAIDPTRGSPLGPSDLAALCAAAAVLGHVFPVFTGFRGGKGVAVAAAAIGALHPCAVPWCLLVFGLGISMTGYVSIASIAAALCFPLAAFLTGSPLPWSSAARDSGALPGILALAAPLAIIATHRGNIRRLALGTERRFPRALLWKRAFDRLRSRSH